MLGYLAYRKIVNNRKDSEEIVIWELFRYVKMRNIKY